MSKRKTGEEAKSCIIEDLPDLYNLILKAMGKNRKIPLKVAGLSVLVLVLKFVLAAM